MSIFEETGLLFKVTIFSTRQDEIPSDIDKTPIKADKEPININEFTEVKGKNEKIIVITLNIIFLILPGITEKFSLILLNYYLLLLTCSLSYTNEIRRLRI